MAGRTPKQAMADSKKKKAQNMGKVSPMMASPAPAMPPSMPGAVPPAGGPTNLASLRSWVPKSKAKAITAKAKKTVKGMK